MTAFAAHRAGQGRRRVQLTTMNAFLLGICVLAVYPFIVMVFGSLKSAGELSTNPSGVPAHSSFANFVDLFTGQPGRIMREALVNTFVVTIPFVALTVLLSAMAGYAFAKYRFWGRNVIFGLLIASMLVPMETNLPVMYIFFSHIGWLNTYQVQIFPGTASVLGMFMARQYMQGIPDEVLEAASLDGAGHWTKFWRFAMPMSIPVLGAIGLLTFVFKFTDYLWPLIMVSDPQHQPIMVALPSLSTIATGFIVEYELVLAGCVIVTLPLLLLFVRFQNTLMRGVAAGAVRG
jgi:ABC-type glycerol-3-phosphate transport system permease component